MAPKKKLTRSISRALSRIFSEKNRQRFTLTTLLLVTLGLSYTRVFDRYELQSYDWRFTLRGDRPLAPEIVLVDIWDDTLDALGAWPFERRHHASLIRALNAYGVQAIAFDILFVENRAGDAEVAAAAREAGNVYFPYGFSEIRPEGPGFVAGGLLAPLLPAYAEAAAAVGHVNPQPGADGTIRKIFPRIDYRGIPFYHLGLRIAFDVLGVSEKDLSWVPGQALRLGDRISLPLDEDGYFLVNYAGRWEATFRHISYLDVLISHEQLQAGETPRLDLRELKGKVCFVGLTALGSHDTKPTPIQSIYPMVGMHANVLNSILQRDFLKRWDRWQNLLLLALLVGLILTISTRLRPLTALGYVLLVLAGYAALALGLFLWKGIWIDLFYPLGASIILYAVATLNRTLFEMRKRELIEKELKIASQIQKSFLPESPPSQKGVQVAVFMKQAKAVGGDLYEFLVLGPDKTGVLVGDVSGKGTPAALFMAKVVSEFKFAARDQTDPARVVADLNDSIAAGSTGGLFVTLSYLILDTRNRELLLADAGHLPVIAVGADGRSRLLTSEEGMPIGLMPGTPFANKKVPLREGDCFALYSDGVSEARNIKKEEFGTDVLTQALVKERHKDARTILEQAVKRLHRFMGRADQHDDITLIIVKVVSADAEKPS